MQHRLWKKRKTAWPKHKLSSMQTIYLKALNHGRGYKHAMLLNW